MASAAQRYGGFCSDVPGDLPVYRAAGRNVLSRIFTNADVREHAVAARGTSLDFVLVWVVSHFACAVSELEVCAFGDSGGLVLRVGVYAERDTDGVGINACVGGYDVAYFFFEKLICELFPFVS